jgi:hypothetical protein
MKATLFSKPLEYKLDVTGESWKQGENVVGKIIVVNHNSQAVSVGSFSTFLVYGQMKKMKAKSPKAFKYINELSHDTNLEITANSQLSFDFNFTLDSDCQITVNSSSLYIISGCKTSIHESVQLQLHVEPITVISSYIEILESFYRFKVKGLKSKEEFIEATVNVPDTKSLSGVQKCKLLMRLKDKNLELKYSYKLIQLCYESGSIETKNIDLEVEQTLIPRQYDMYGSPNHEGIKKSIEEMLLQVKAKPLI